MKIVVLTNNSSLYGKKIINALLSRDIRIATVVVIKQPLNYYLKLFKYVKKRVGFVDAVYFSIQRIFHAQNTPIEWNGREFINRYADMGIPIIYTRGTNSHQTIESLKRCEPDLLLLGQAGIIKERILQIPKVGTLNAHPGILPYYRGIDAERWAIYHDDFENLGASVHWVDSGVDTGDIIVRERYRIRGDEKTLEMLSDNLYDLAFRMLAQVVLALIAKKELPRIMQNRRDGKQHYKMSRKQEEIVRRKLREHIPFVKLKE